MTTVPEVGAAKSALRERLLARRPRAPGRRAGRSRGRADGRAAARTGRRPDHRGLRPRRGRARSRRLPAAFTQLGARVLLPVVPMEGRELTWAVDTGRLTPGRFGLLEPLGPRLGPTAIGTADVVVVPALAVASDGVRLGRGGGYYDRALQHARGDAVLVALVFDDELVDELPSRAARSAGHRRRDPVRRLAGATGESVRR